MNFFETRKFRRQYPGPFAWYDGSDGVDSTCDVICLATDQRIISTYYWDEAEEAGFITDIVATALNRFAVDLNWPVENFMEHVVRKELAEFFNEYPGPFNTQRDNCPNQGAVFNIYCETSGKPVIHRFNFDSINNARRVSKHVAKSLNNLRDYHHRTELRS